MYRIVFGTRTPTLPMLLQKGLVFFFGRSDFTQPNAAKT